MSQASRFRVGKMSLWLVMVSMVPFYYGVFLPLWQSIFLPAPYYIQLPQFKGRILPEETMKRGNSYYPDDFGSLPQWPEDAVLYYVGYEAHSPKKDCVRLTAWRLDQKTGDYHRAEKRIPVAEYGDWGEYHSIARIEREGGFLRVVPGITKRFWECVFAGSLLTLGVLLFALSQNPTFIEWNKRLKAMPLHS